ncbi:hypothetical protein FRB94_000312 [Tulasnella sp. JGI-2019a]|nr:hypothetical protein FRB94_000312 [Tulasnella sp. JGI-2019a]
MDHSGSDAMIIMDGAAADSVPTCDPAAVAYSTCNKVTKSIAIPNGTHQLRIVNAPVNTSLPVIYFQSIGNSNSNPPGPSLAGSATSTRDPTTAATMDHSAVVAVTISGIAIIALIIAAIFYIRRRARKNQGVDLLDTESEAAGSEWKTGASGRRSNFTNEGSISIFPFVAEPTPALGSATFRANPSIPSASSTARGHN